MMFSTMIIGETIWQYRSGKGHSFRGLKIKLWHKPDNKNNIDPFQRPQSSSFLPPLECDGAHFFRWEAQAGEFFLPFCLRSFPRLMRVKIIFFPFPHPSGDANSGGGCDTAELFLL